MGNHSFRKLNVYQNSIILVKSIYGLLDSFPKKEQFALCDQLRRACVSVPSNIAEGMSRTSEKEKIHFLEISFGSLMEVLCQLDISKELNYITQAQLEESEEQITIIAKQLSRLRSSLNPNHKPNP